MTHISCIHTLFNYSILFYSIHSIGIFDIFGAALAFNIKINIYTEGRCMAIYFDQSYIGEIDMLFLETTGEFCSLVDAPNFGGTCSDHNVYCQVETPSAPSMTCGDCLLQYHLFCAERPTCGCSGTTELSARYIVRFRCFSFLFFL